MKRKIICNLFFFLTLAFMLQGKEVFGQANRLELRAGSYDNYPKVYYAEDGEVTGLFPEILQYIAYRENWNITYIPGSWAECLERLENSEIDIMADVAYSQEREKLFDFTRETVLVNWGIVYTSQDSHIESFPDLEEKKIATMRGSIHTDGQNGIRNILDRFAISAELIEVEDYSAVFAMVESGEADAGVVNRIFGSRFAEDYDLKRTPIIFNPIHLKFAFPKNAERNRELIRTIDQYIRILKQDQNSLYHRAIDAYLSGQPEALRNVSTEEAVIKINLTEHEKRWIEEHPDIRLGVDPEFIPFEYIADNGDHRGIASDYVKILNRKLGLNMTVVKGISWNQAVEMTKNGEVDVLPCVGKTEERLTYLKFSRPYIRYERAIITRTDFPFIRGIADAEKLQVAVQRNSSHEGYLKEHTSIKPVLYDTLQQSLLSVSEGKTDVFIGNSATSTYWIRQLNIPNLKIASQITSGELSLYFAVRRDWPELVQILNKGLRSISSEEQKEIYNKWISVEYRQGVNPKKFFRYIAFVSFAALIILSAIFIWNILLKKEIDRRSAAEAKLQEANTRLLELDKLKSMFIASMSHELRTPLNSIIGFTGIILKGLSGSINAQQEDQLRRVYSSAKHLLHLITDVIDISKIEAGRVDSYAEEFRLSDVIDEVSESLRIQIEKKQLNYIIKTDSEIILNQDRRRLMQCVLNLVSNAVKYTEEGTITVRSKQNKCTAEIQISDTGIGISREQMLKVFEPFERLDSHLKIKAGGTGLGLYLTKKIVREILKGDVAVESREGAGSTFTLTVPLDLGVTIHTPEEEYNAECAGD